MRQTIAACAVLWVLGLGAVANGQEPHRRVGDETPPRGNGRVHVDLMFVPQSLDDLVQHSDAIVRVRVSSILPSRILSRQFGGGLETDAEVAIRSVIKGTVPAPSVLIAEIGGHTDTLTITPVSGSLMQAGEEYILFLNRDARPNLPNEKNLERYVVTCAWIGKLRIRDGAVLFDKDAPEKLRMHNGRTVDAVAAEISAMVARPG